MIQIVYFAQLPTLNVNKIYSAKEKLFHLYEQAKDNILNFITWNYTKAIIHEVHEQFKIETAHP